MLLGLIRAHICDDKRPSNARGFIGDLQANFSLEVLEKKSLKVPKTGVYIHS